MKGETRAALVTGAGQGIGRAICAALAADGWDLVLNDLDETLARQAAEELAAESPARSIIAVGGDVSDAAVADACVRAAVDKLGGLQAAVANAGVTTFQPFLEMPRAALERLLEVNVLGTWSTVQAAARAMAAAGGGRIVLLSSVAGLRGIPGLAGYGLTKAAIAGLARSLAVELGPHRIAVNAVAPGATVTERTVLEQPDYEAEWAAVTPLRRTGSTADVAGVVRFLLGPDGGHVSGQTLTVDGGWTGQAPVPGGY
jgi:glucose 1-dehydrogenase